MGWEQPLDDGGRYHLVPSDGYYTIHRDSKAHHLTGGRKTGKRLEAIVDKLNGDMKKLFKSKMKHKLIRFLKKVIDHLEA